MNTGLDPAQLSALPKINPQRSVLDYVKCQALFCKDYAKEGQAYATTWGAQEDTCTNEPTQTSAGAFATPVLKPRVARLAQKAERKHNAKDPSHQEAVVKKHESDKRREPRKEAACPVDSPMPKDRVKSKDNAKPKGAVKRQTDEESRLRERRERKRAKKAIMEPDKENCAKRKENDSKSKSGSKKTKLPAGLALMHGFTATNVGRHRLTIDPPLRLGVFNKGKASTQTRVGKKKGTPAESFSENKFLNPKHESKRSGNMRRTSSASLSDGDLAASSDVQVPGDQARSPSCRPTERASNSSGSSDGSASPESTRAKKKKKSRKRKTMPKTQKPTKESYASQPKKADSIVWDIEKEDGVLRSDSSLKSHRPKPSTVLIDVTQTKWCQNSGQQQENDFHKADAIQPHPRLEPPEDSTKSVASLCPSESLSQKVPGMLLETDKAKCVFQESKYFELQDSLEHEACEEQENLRPQITENPSVYPGRICEDATIRIDSPAINSPAINSPAVDSPVVDSLAPYFNEYGIASEVKYHIRAGADDWLFGDSNAANDFMPDCGDESFPEVVHDERLLEPSRNELKSYLAASRFGVGDDSTPNLDQVPDHDFNCDTQVYDVPDMGISPLLTQSYDAGDREESYLTTLLEDDCSNQDHHYAMGQLTRNPGTTSDISSLVSQDMESVQQSQTSSFMPFSEGRKLLYGQVPVSHNDLPRQTLDSVEADVAKNLVSHWFPQKY